MDTNMYMLKSEPIIHERSLEPNSQYLSKDCWTAHPSIYQKPCWVKRHMFQGSLPAGKAYDESGIDLDDSLCVIDSSYRAEQGQAVILYGRCVLRHKWLLNMPIPLLCSTVCDILNIQTSSNFNSNPTTSRVLLIIAIFSQQQRRVSCTSTYVVVYINSNMEASHNIDSLPTCTTIFNAV